MPASGQMLVKFDKREHMQGMYEVGEIQISPASSYSDPSLNPARQDDELAIELRMDSKDVIVSIRGSGTDGFQDLPGVIGDLVHTKRTADYYVYCIALTADPQLFGDFESDACVIIHDPPAFIQRLRDAVELKLPGWCFRSGHVKYIDSYPTSPKDFMKPDIDLCFTKLLSFSHQQEYRFAWVLLPLDQENQEPYEPFAIKIGSLREIADLRLANYR